MAAEAKPASSRFWRECATRALKRTSEFANDWQWVFGAPLISWVGAYFASDKGVITWTTGNSIFDAFLVALAVFLVTAVVAFFCRIYQIAPQLYESEKKRAASLEQRLNPAMKVFLEDGGIYTFPIGDLSRSHFVQVSVAPTTDVPLIDCEVHVTGVKQINADGTKIPLLQESAYASWSNEPPGTIKRDIPAGITKRANLFSWNEKHHELTMHITHPKVILMTMTYTHGAYEIDIRVSARDAISISRLYVFKWGPSFDDISLTEVS